MNERKTDKRILELKKYGFEINEDHGSGNVYRLPLFDYDEGMEEDDSFGDDFIFPISDDGENYLDVVLTPEKTVVFITSNVYVAGAEHDFTMDNSVRTAAESIKDIKTLYFGINRKPLRKQPSPFINDPGYIDSKRNQINGEWVVVYKVVEREGLDTSKGKYAKVCSFHPSIYYTTSIAKALSHLSYPEFCEDCMMGMVVK